MRHTTITLPASCASGPRAKSGRSARPRISFAALALGLLAVGCSSSSDDGGPKQQVEDMLGRTCTLASAGKVTCDAQPEPVNGCKTGETACFQLGTTGSAAGPGAICAACCDGNSSTSYSADCSNLVCSSNDDCPPEYGRCMSGVCRY